MSVFLDTNIVIDALANRTPFDESAKKLIFLSQIGEVEAWCGSSQFTDFHYILSCTEAGANSEELIEVLKDFRGKIKVCSLTEEDVDKALGSGWKDFEDACLFSMATRVDADYIITRNKADFEGGLIPVVDCDEFFAALEEQGIIYEEITF